MHATLYIHVAPASVWVTHEVPLMYVGGTSPNRVRTVGAKS